MADHMEWMAKPILDREAYLLGKPVDKSLEQLDNDGVPTSNEDIGTQPGALFLEAAASAALEAEVKQREDPLYAIKKKEEEQRRALLNNPIRLKKLQEELEQRRKQEERKLQKKSKDLDLTSKLLKLKSKYGKDLKDLLNDDDEDDSREKRSSRHREDRYDFRNSRSSGNRHSSGSKSYSSKSAHQHSSSSHRRRKSSRSSTSSSSDRDRRRSPSSQRDRKRRSRSRDTSRKSPSHGATTTSSARAPVIVSKPKPYQKPVRTFQKLSPEELERKRQEMLADAKVRDVERSQNVSEYRKRDLAEEEKDKSAASGKSGGFIRPMLSSAADTGTLESRLQSNRNKIQRTSAALEKNFTQR